MINAELNAEQMSNSEAEDLSNLMTDMMPVNHRSGWKAFSMVAKRMCRNSCCCCLTCSKVCLNNERHKRVQKIIDETIEMNLACLGCCRLCVIFPIYYILYCILCLVAGCYAWVLIHPQSGFCITEGLIIYFFEPNAATLKMFQVLISRFFFISGQRAEVCI